MEIFHKCRTHIPIFSLIAFLLHFSSLHFLSLADDYFINCGSDANVNLTTGQTFVGDSNSGSSFSNSGSSFSEGIAIKAINQLPVSPLYLTARASSQPFYYKFKITENGTYLVRLHFLAFSSSSYNLSAAVFDVSDSRKFSLLKNFTAKNFTNSFIIKELFLRIDSTDSLKLYFTPQTSTLAFVNAIEFFLAPSDFTDFTPENYTGNLPLNTIYRVNVGGPSLNDTIERNWETDDSYLPDPNSALKRIQDAVKRNYYGEIDGLVASNDSVAPDLVYQTARVMNITTSRPANSSNITWSFSVSRNAGHIVRAHFCDITGAAPGNIVFNLYSNGNFRKEIGSSDNPISTYPGLPFYYDFVVNSSESELIKISIRPNTDATVPNAFLNGLEILEIMEGSAPIPNVKEPKKNTVALVVGSVLGGLSLICILVAGFVFGLRRRKAEKGVETSVWSPMPANGGSSHSRVTERTITGSPMNLINLGLKISFSDIQSVTNNFDPKLLIGKGGFGNVYRGTLYGTKVAVKRAYKRDEQGSGSGQGLPEFQTEITVLSKIRHRHLVSLIGYCDQRSEMILVYEFMENGTLRDHLYASNLPRLSWKQRLEICTGAARGLQYLHTAGAAGAIIHRDVKSTNILLDEKLVAKVADFGLSRSGHLDGTHVSTVVKGTIGYLDPEYMMTQQLTEKSDVYSFGIVLLEVLCGRPPIDPALPREQMNLAEWVMVCKKKGLLEQIVDSPLKGQIDLSSLRKFVEIAEKCLQDDACDRPTMGDVLWDLEYALQLQPTTRLKEAHEDSTTMDASSAAFSLPNVQRFPSLGSTINGDDMREDDLDTTENEIFSQLKIGDAR